MELQTTITDVLFLFVVAVLTFMPIFAVPSAWKIFKVWRSDNERPRNAILKVLTAGSTINALASVFFTMLTVGFWSDRLSDAPWDADFGGVLFAIVLIAVGYSPYMKWRALKKLDGRAVDISEIPETQDQREDRQFGQKRRELEAEHNEELTASE